MENDTNKNTTPAEEIKVKKKAKATVAEVENVEPTLAVDLKPESFVSFEDLPQTEEDSESGVVNNKPARKKRTLKTKIKAGGPTTIKKKTKSLSMTKFKKIRINLGWSQFQMAQKLGISQGMVSLVESGNQTLKDKALLKFKKIAAKRK